MQDWITKIQQSIHFKAAKQSSITSVQAEPLKLGTYLFILRSAQTFWLNENTNNHVTVGTTQEQAKFLWATLSLEIAIPRLTLTFDVWQSQAPRDERNREDSWLGSFLTRSIHKMPVKESARIRYLLQGQQSSSKVTEDR